VDSDRKLSDSDLDARLRRFVYRHIIRRETSPTVCGPGEGPLLLDEADSRQPFARE